MTNLDPLIRVRKHAVEQKQKFLAELYRQAEQLQTQKTTLLQTLAQEQIKMTELGIQMLPYFGPYSKAVHERVDDIDDALKRLDARIIVAREDMREAFAEFKKIEITAATRAEAAAQAVKKKEDQTIDDVALDIFRRQDDVNQ